VKGFSRKAWVCGAGAVAMIGAMSSLGRHESFGVTFLYVASTLLVVAMATVVTILGIAGRGHREAARDPAPGLVETGFLIGFFVTSPLALIGVFQILQALVGPP